MKSTPENEEQIMRRMHRKQHKIQDSKRKSQSSHSTSSRNVADTTVPRKSNKKKPHPKPGLTEDTDVGKNEALSESAEVTHCGASSSGSSTSVDRLRYSSGHRYCTAGHDGGIHITYVQRKDNNHESERNTSMRRHYPMITERRRHRISKRRPFVDQYEKSNCNADCANTKRRNRARHHKGKCSHGNDIDDDSDYKIDQGDVGVKDCENVCWRLPKHLLDDRSNNLYPLLNDGYHSGFTPYQCSNPWSRGNYDEQLYADYCYKNYNQYYNYYYAYNDCYFYQQQPEAFTPLYPPEHFFYNCIFEDKKSVSSNDGGIHMLYQKICQDFNHGNFSNVSGNLGFPHDFSRNQVLPAVLENDVSTNGGSAGIVEQSSRRYEPSQFQDQHAFPINQPDSVVNTLERNIPPACLPLSEIDGRLKTFLPDGFEYTQRHVISTRVKPADDKKQKSAVGSLSAEDAEFDRAFKRIMMEQFSLFTNFTPGFSKWCLDSCNWNYGEAAWNFIYDLHEKQKIPCEAYNI